ncbi:MAG: hypothetical protein ABIG95_06500 [Candidatus Woesearchaeota archaeon]
MESITIKVHREMLREIEKAVDPDYGTKSEFVREAIRDRLKQIRKERAISQLREYFGKAKTRTTYSEERKTREEVGRKIAKKYGIDLE